MLIPMQWIIICRMKRARCNRERRAPVVVRRRPNTGPKDQPLQAHVLNVVPNQVKGLGTLPEFKDMVNRLGLSAE